MMDSDSSGCCRCGGGCCEPEKAKRQLMIDFLYLDLSVCGRCRNAENNLDEAVGEVSEVLKAAGFEVAVNKVNITSKELAVKYRFLSSPTIRVNGNDIALDVKESSCRECGDLCGDNVDCRVWVYEGVEYSEPPKAMIVNAILKAVYSGRETDPTKKEAYILPDNLKAFFDGLERKVG